MRGIVRPRVTQPAYVGPVATRCRLNCNLATGGPFQINKRTYHYARENIGWLRIGYPNWYANLNTGEAGGGAGVTIAASIEYPFTTSTTGTTCKVATWGGAATVSAPTGTTVWSDWMYFPIPIGAKFGSRLWISNTTTNAYSDSGTTLAAWRDTANGDFLNFTSANQTAGGAMTNDGSQLDITPLILGMTRRPTIAIIGDSRQCGWADTVDATVGDAGEVARSYGKQFAYFNLAIGGETLADFIATNGALSALRRALAAYCSHVSTDMGINDVANGVAAATVQANMTTMLGLAGIVGKRTIYDVMLPESTSTDSWATTANQTTNANNAARNTVNTWLAGGNAANNGVNDIRTPLEFPIIPSGKWNVPGQTADGTHPTQAGYQAVMNGGCVDPNKIVLLRR